MPWAFRISSTSRSCTCRCRSAAHVEFDGAIPAGQGAGILGATPLHKGLSGRAGLCARRSTRTTCRPVYGRRLRTEPLRRARQDRPDRGPSQSRVLPGTSRSVARSLRSTSIPGQDSHWGIATTVWGMPDLDSMDRVPNTPVLAINRPDGDGWWPGHRGPEAAG